MRFMSFKSLLYSIFCRHLQYSPCGCTPIGRTKYIFLLCFSYTCIVNLYIVFLATIWEGQRLYCVIPRDSVHSPNKLVSEFSGSSLRMELNMQKNKKMSSQPRSCSLTKAFKKEETRLRMHQVMEG